jgi:diguanylate cyclase (GGDEF)-like protein/PAS domain S-box-containing protein
MADIDKTNEQLVAELGTIALTAKHDKGLFQIVLSCLPMPYLLVDTHERVVQTNQACLDMLEIDGPVESCYGQTLAQVFYNDPTRKTVVGQSILEDKIFLDIEVPTKSHRGRELHILANVFPLYDVNNICIGGMCIYVDSTERKRAEEALRYLEKSYRDLIEFAPVGIFQSSPKGRYLMANPLLAEIYGYDSVRDLMESVRDIKTQIYVDPREHEAIYEALERGIVDRMEVQRRRKDGSIIWVSLSMRAVRDQTGKVLYYEGFCRNITRRRLAEDALRESEERYRNFFASGESVKLIIDPDTGAIKDANPAAAEFYGYDLGQLRGMLLHDLEILPREKIPAEWPQASKLERVQYCSRHRLASGDIREVEVYTSSIPDKGKSLLMSSIHDITERKQLEDKLKELATVDSLTGLNNRRHFMELSGLLFETAKRYGSHFAVVMLDIDHFKAINDFWGHEAGDLVLKNLSQIAQTSFRSTDVLGRVGGDEFAVVMPETDHVATMSAMERFRDAVDSAVITYEGTPLSITVSCGVAQFVSENFTLDGLLKKADMALYKAKRDGRNRVVAFSEPPAVCSE